MDNNTRNLNHENNKNKGIRMNCGIRLLLACLIFYFMVSCKNSVNTFKEKELDTLYSVTHFLWPLKVGSYWDYNQYSFAPNYEIYNLDSTWTYENFSSFGVNLDTIQIEPSFHRQEIVDSIYINIDDTVYSCHVFGGYDPIQKKYYDLKFPYWIGNDGIYNMGIYEDKGDSLFKKSLYIPSEISEDTNWGGKIFYRVDGHMLHTTSVIERNCLSKNEVLNTPFGDFECYVIFTRSWVFDVHSYYDYYRYFAPEIGLICIVKLAVMPETPDGEVQWWLDYILLLDNCSIK